MFGKFQFRKLQFGESIKGKLFFETVRPYHISDSKILIGEQLMTFIHNVDWVCLGCDVVVGDCIGGNFVPGEKVVVEVDVVGNVTV